ncbi:GEVED domain-containing protein [uncultured Chryseobacterium sp.]|uniref:GEVED domain-containing protein n=1 Tax=uncultured Chryseobacterium sp. TaxID=259322 RepID=UPI0025F427FC|nr:GEVED domain-containing protein [uncultured Chryseobacterium sp.]
MTKQLLFFIIFLSGISLFYSKNLTAKEPGYCYLCDTAPANVQVSNITMTSGTVTWTNDPTVTSYTIRFRQYPASAWVNVNQVSVNAFTITSLMPCTTYEVQVAKVCSGSPSTSAWSPSLLFTTLNMNYCAASSLNANVAYTSNVTVTPAGSVLSPMVSNSGTSNYTDYRSDPTRKVQLMIGSTGNQISVSKTWTGSPNPVFVRAWIDFNGDGVFDSSELILSSGSSASSTATSTFNVPATAYQTGTTCGIAMRVMISETLTGSTCGTFSYGEVEDYGVYLLTPANLSAEEINNRKNISIYPNPASDVLNISGIEGAEFEIYSTAAQRVSKGKISGQKVPVHDLVKGVYFIEIRDHNHITKLKFIKE